MALKSTIHKAKSIVDMDRALLCRQLKLIAQHPVRNRVSAHGSALLTFMLTKVHERLIFGKGYSPMMVSHLAHADYNKEHSPVD